MFAWLLNICHPAYACEEIVHDSGIARGRQTQRQGHVTLPSGLFVSQSLLETLELAEDPAFLETPLKRGAE